MRFAGSSVRRASKPFGLPQSAPSKERSARLIAAVQSARLVEALTEFVILVNEKTGEFSTFLATAQKAGLVEARSGNKKLTVFAPADTTFADIAL